MPFLKVRVPVNCREPLDAFRSPSAKDAGQTGALFDLYFALTSQSGT